ncbi:hypothetical protein KC865_01575 [Candidatus Kaiserbacteria bacterium]|nr:hypothetical protein [Candidatus Kaiserbacteria bacterium]
MSIILKDNLGHFKAGTHLNQDDYQLLLPGSIIRARVKKSRNKKPVDTLIRIQKIRDGQITAIISGF